MDERGEQTESLLRVLEKLLGDAKKLRTDKLRRRVMPPPQEAPVAVGEAEGATEEAEAAPPEVADVAVVADAPVASEDEKLKATIQRLLARV